MTAPTSTSPGDFRLDTWATRPPYIEVLATGPSATIQDLGRPGLAEFGVGPSGAADRPSLRLANRLVGNPEGHAAVEITFGGLRMYAPIHVYAGDEVYVGPSGRGMRSYLAVRGGIALVRRRRAGRAVRPPGVRGHHRQQPHRHAAGRTDAAPPQRPRAAPGGHARRGAAGAARRPAHPLPHRSPGDRGLPGDRRGPPGRPHAEESADESERQS